MTKLQQFNEIVRDFRDVADFVIIYVEEAHPSDGWAFKVRKRFSPNVYAAQVYLFFVYSLFTANPAALCSLKMKYWPKGHRDRIVLTVKTLPNRSESQKHPISTVIAKPSSNFLGVLVLA